METKKVTKWYWVWDYEKEELWLNAMAQEGWALQRVGFATYYFERTEPGEYEVRLECRKADDAYISFVQETGGRSISVGCSCGSISAARARWVPLSSTAILIPGSPSSTPSTGSSCPWA